MTPDHFAHAFRFLHTLREHGAVVWLQDDGQVACDVTRVDFVDAYGEHALHFVFATMHDDLAEVLRLEAESQLAH